MVEPRSSYRLTFIWKKNLQTLFNCVLLKPMISGSVSILRVFYLVRRTAEE